MANMPQSPTAKVDRLLTQHKVTLGVVLKHAHRLAAARARIDSVDGDLEMYAQHRAVTDEAREAVTAALAETESLLTAIDEDGELPPLPVKPARNAKNAVPVAEDDEDEDAEDAEDEDAEDEDAEDVTVPDDARELV